ncbi:glycoside hydrolase superfamily [Microdochium trichocladiopsis]|uniref:Probable glucan endo-1,3-beta-glucosidase eglC n=1 Tax=Microdochium trichocladiopsis TaxID=1682393 RepID=A0A9P8Y717_9PEZI|nr:glycoside hydrolase superfamily [Microdochium trichocladiopsis]KAH7031093.1 glycoside hydrolase superfamily [Microdochium trichocladiopsis]
MRTATASASLLALASTAAAIKGFNYGSTFTTGAAKTESDFEAEFRTAAGLDGTSGFTSARLYTMIQAGTTSDPISAIPAALNTGTTLLLGLWASGGETVFANEILALKAAIQQYGSAFANAVDGISVGSEDLYRNSPQGIAAGSFVGANPDVIVNYINQVRDAIAGTALSGAKIGHVDTWTAWVNGSNQAVVNACDWIGQDAYPYFQQENANAIGNNKALFDEALAATTGAVGGKPVWVTETGYPVSGKTVGQAVPSLENAETYWQEVGCPLFQSSNVWWYTLQDAAPATPNPSFGIIGSTLTTTPLYNLTCGAVGGAGSSSSSSSAASSEPTPSSSSIAPSSSAAQSSAGQGSSQAPPATSSVPDSGGSPGGIPSSQIVIESSETVTPSVTTTYPSSAAATPSQGGGTGGGSVSTGGSSIGAGGSSSSATTPSTTASTSAPATVPTLVGGQGRSAVASSATFFAFVVAVVAAVLI